MSTQNLLDRVILSTTEHGNHIEFWPLVATAWRRWLGVKVSLALVTRRSADDLLVRELSKFGEVVIFPETPGIPNQNLAKVSRYLLASRFPDEVCLIDDVDMLPLQSEYYLNLLQQRKRGEIMIVGAEVYENTPHQGKHPIANLTSEGAGFKAWLNPQGLDDARLLESWKGIREFDAKESVDTDPAMFSDESLLRVLARRHSDQSRFRHVRRGFYPYTARALDRSDWRIDFDKLKSGYYVEAHLLRPLSKYKEQIEPLAIYVSSSPAEDPEYWNKIAASVAKARQMRVVNAAEVAYAHLKDNSRFGETAPLVSQGLINPAQAASAATVPPPPSAASAPRTAAAPARVPSSLPSSPASKPLTPMSLPVAIVTETMNYTSGGIRCIAEVLNRLQDRGYRTACFVTQPDLRCDWLTIKFPILPASELAGFNGILISPFSPTAQLVANSNATGKFYWVHSYEPKFPEITGRPDSWRVMSENSYRLPQLQYFATSNYVKSILELIYRREVLSALVPGGVDVNLFKPCPRQNRIPRVMFLSRENPFRGARDIIQALQMVRQHGVELDICVMGQPLSMEGLPHRHFPPLPQPEFAKLLASADIFVHASHFEGLPLPPLEAMACKCAVIATPVGASDYLLDGYNALVVPVKRPDKIASALLRLAGDAALRERLGEGGHRTVLGGYTWEHTVDRLEEVLKEGMAQKGVALISSREAPPAVPAGGGKSSRLMSNWLERADKAFARGDQAAAKDCLMAAHDLDPERVEIVAALSGLAFQSGAMAEAYAWIEKASALRPQDATLHVRKAAVAIRLERIDDFERAVGEALKLDPNQPDAMQLLAELNFQQGHYAEAANWFKRLLQFKSTDLNVLLVLGKCFFEIKDYEAAELVYSQVLQLDPSHQLARENLAVLAKKKLTSEPVPGPGATTPAKPVSWLNRPMRVRQSVDGSGMLEVNGVQGYMLEGDIHFLFNLAQKLPLEAKLLEVGSFMGLSSIIIANGLLAAGNSRAEIHCVDTWLGSEGHQKLEVVKHNQLYDRFLENIRQAGVDALIKPVRKTSAAAAADFPDACFDLVFIDGDHSFEGCYADLKAYYPKLKPGGVFIGHDCTPDGGVRKALLQFANERRLTYEITEPPRAHFIFQLYHPADRRSEPAPAPEAVRPAASLPPPPKEEPLVSAIVSAYKSERFLQGCLEDLEAQTIAARLEIVVVDTGSPENERRVVEEFQQRYSNIVYIRTDTRETVYAAWNRGIQAAHGKYLTNANTDDRHRKDAFEILARTLDEHPDITLAYADCLITRTENETFETAHPVGTFRWHDFDPMVLLTKGCFVGPQPMWRREVHAEHGCFDPTFVSAGDYEFWLRIASSRKFLHVQEALGLYLESPASVEHANRERAAWETQEARTRYSERIAPHLHASSAPAGSKTEGHVTKIELPPAGQVGRLRVGYEIFAKNDFLGVWKFGLEALTLRPFHPEALLMMGQAAQAAGDLDLARQCAKRSLELAPQYDLALEFLGALPKKAKKRKLSWPHLPPSRAKAEPTLSVCVIAKNEEQFIRRCLESIRPVATQIVLVDTGSTDKTVDIAKELGAEIHRFPWNDNFSDARNSALEHARCDWVLVLDADEEIPAAEHDKLRAMMRRPEVIGCRLPLVNCGIMEQGGTFVPRMFRNAPGIFFVGRIHEQVFPSVQVRGAEWKMRTVLEGPTIFHHGYDDATLVGKQKVSRNLKLLEQAVVEMPGEPHLVLNLGLELVRSGRPLEGLVQYREAFRLMSQQPSGSVTPELREALLSQYPVNLILQKLYEEAIQVLQSPLAVSFGLTAGMHYSLGCCYFQLQQFEKAVAHMRECVEHRKDPVHWPVIQEIHTAAPRHTMANALVLLNRRPEAARAFLDAVAEDPANRPVRIDYARFLHQQGESVEALNLLHAVVTEDASQDRAWELGGAIVLSKPDFFEVAWDWTGEAFRSHPDHPKIRSQRAEMLLLAQEPAQSLELWRQMSNLQPGQEIARFICLLALRKTEPAPEAGPSESLGRFSDEIAMSREFIAWYRRLLAWQSAEIVGAINGNLPLLQQTLPSAASAIGSAVATADREAATLAG